MLTIHPHPEGEPHHILGCEHCGRAIAMPKMMGSADHVEQVRQSQEAREFLFTVDIHASGFCVALSQPGDGI